MTTTDKMLTRKDGHIGYLTFNNPSRHNAVSLDMWEACADIMSGFAKDADVRVVVISGTGEKAFIAGADISKFEQERASAPGVARYNEAVDQGYRAVADFPKPTIAMIRGYCIGGGMGLATCCDIRIAADNAKFGVPAAKLGLGYSYPGVKRLADIVGPSFTKEIFYTARQFDADEARAMGLVNRVLPVAELETYVRDYAAIIAGNAPLTVDSIKLITDQVYKAESQRDMKACEDAVAACFASDDYKEGRAAFMEKRKPVFKGR